MLTFDTFDYFLNLFTICVLAVPVFYLLPWEKARELLLTLVGAYLLYLIAPRLLLFYLLFWAVVALLDRIVAKTAPTRLGLPSLFLSVGVLLGLLVVWRLAEAWFVVNFNLVFNDMLRPLSTRAHEVDLSRNIITPIGMSFAVFRAIDLLITSNLGMPRDRSLRKTYFIGLFPPIQIIGPVAQASELRIALKRPKIDDFQAALQGTIRGLFKIMVLAHLTSSAVDVLIYYENNSVWAIWLELFIYVLFFYWNFSGYSDLAIAVSALFGARLRPNFDSPLTKQNPRDFWNSWHMSLANFAQRNVFVPMGGMRRGNRQFFALFVTMMTIALWHDISIPLVIFGVYHSAGLILHRVVAERRPPRNSTVLAATKTTVLFVFYYAISVPLISLDTSEILSFYSRLIGL